MQCRQARSIGICERIRFIGQVSPPLGREAEQLVDPAKAFAVLHPDDRARVQGIVDRTIAEKASYTVEYRASWQDGSTHWVRSTGAVICDETGEGIRLLGVDLVITTQKQVEATLVQTEKLAAVGRLASTMAHEINNPLEAVTNLLYLARQAGDIMEARPYPETADAELRRAATITSQALRFHKQAFRPTLSAFETLTHDLFAGRHSRLQNSGAKVETRDRTSQSVLCFEGEVRQVLNNLVVNAINALSARGRHLFSSGERRKRLRDGQDGDGAHGRGYRFGDVVADDPEEDV